MTIPLQLTILDSGHAGDISMVQWLVGSCCGPPHLLLGVSNYEMPKILRKHPISMACISTLEGPRFTSTYKKMAITRERISCSFELRVMLLSIHIPSQVCCGLCNP